MSRADIAPEDLVLEIGAGTGRITQPLALAAREVRAIEMDPEFASALRRRFGSTPNVEVVEADVLSVQKPRERFRAFGNVPFGITTDILRWLLDEPDPSLVRSDLIVQLEAARKRTAVWPSNVTSLGWLPWWRFRLERRIAAAAFEPAPSVDAAMLCITKREVPLLDPGLRFGYLSLVRSGFRRADLPVSRSLRHRLPDRTWKRFARERGLDPRATPTDLDALDWIALFERLRFLGIVRAGRSDR